LTLLDYLDHRSSACVGTFAGLYRATLERIEARGFDVFDGPPRLTTLTKLRIVAANLV
jgi:phytoene/squalene synthetase